jgi:hypothetical protein
MVGLYNKQKVLVLPQGYERNALVSFLSDELS